MMSRTRLIQTLAAAFALLWVALALSPFDRSDWLLENVLTAVGVGVLVSTRRVLPLSNASYVSIFVFFCLHTIGAHYTYSEVPYLEAWASLTGEPVPAGGTRNHFDRIIHFLYGLMLTRPWREAFYFAMTPRRDFWSHLVVVSFSMATSLLYELFEWAAAVLWGGEAGMAFLGTQGDVWDAHKDMLLATIGSVLACVVMVLRRIFTGRDPACEWGESRRSFTTTPGAP